MQSYTVFLIGAITGIIALMLLGDTSGAAIHLPTIYWTLDLVKYVLSLFIAIILMMWMFWYFA